jgi:hypothetical protein
MTDDELKTFLDANDITILEKKKNDRIVVKNKFGICEVEKRPLKRGILPTIVSSLDKNEYFKNLSISIHGDKYDYSCLNYVNSITKIKLICPKHGEFWITPASHINKKQGCQKCSKERPSKRLVGVDEFKKRANIIHNNFYDYSLITTYKGRNGKVIIKCPIHGEFIQCFKSHLQGAGCYECGKKRISESRGRDPTGWSLSRWIDAAQKSESFDSYKVYIIECYNNDERFIKIGRTFRDIKKRFRTPNMMPYNFTILHEFIDSGVNIFKLEHEIKSLCKDYKYLPKISFNGKCECYTKDCLNEIPYIQQTI